MKRVPITMLAWLFAICAGQAQAVTYTIDPAHTYPVFEIDHLGFSTQRGQFDESKGFVEFDQAAQSGRIEVQIQTASLDTGHTLRDEILRGADWFDSAQFPVMTYRGQRFVFNGGQPVSVEGELTLRGVTRPLKLEIKRFKCGLNLAAKKRGCGADAIGTIKRSEFGMATGLPFVGDEVRLLIQVEASVE